MDEIIVNKYRVIHIIQAMLANITLPMEALQCENVSCTKHRIDIDLFYNTIFNCLQGCVKQCRPNIKLHEFRCRIE